VRLQRLQVNPWASPPYTHKKGPLHPPKTTSTSPSFIHPSSSSFLIYARLFTFIVLLLFFFSSVIVIIPGSFFVYFRIRSGKRATCAFLYIYIYLLCHFPSPSSRFKGSPHFVVHQTGRIYLGAGSLIRAISRHQIHLRLHSTAFKQSFSI
jgi:hypothetical protein